MTEQTTDENKLIAERRSKLDAIRKQQAVAFPNTFRRSDTAESLQQALGDKDKAELESLDRKAAIAGRIMAKRGPFFVIQDVTGRIQAYADKKLAEPMGSTVKTWDIGDIVGVTGPVHKSGKGDLYVFIESCELLTKALRPLPDKYHGLSDTEIRYRQRYVDLIMSENARRVFVTRTKIINTIREFLNARDFLEVETPMMQTIPGGATAKPFVTYHNALDMQMYLRIAPELYLKRLVVGGFERVFEINRNFRNEGLSTRHNPEFTMLEFYQAYANYQDLMDLTEDMLRTLAQNILGRTEVQYQGETYDFGKPFARMTVFDSILHFNPEISADQLNNLEGARKVAESLKIPLKDTWGLGKVQIEIFEKTVEHRLRQPTFITAYPTEVSPLARLNDNDPFVTDRLEFFVGGREIANGFSELNDPEDQAERFRKQRSEERRVGKECRYR